ncbi:hypothetical protein FACS189472_13110 [Alphaproteobacteria bacterium]|nr:hypothetical protein FACS189472_13110 [Alphaproteobacteria bacterium]
MRVRHALFKDGDVIRGCTCVVDNQTEAVTVEAGQVYWNGSIRDVNEGNFTIPIDISVKIGVYFSACSTCINASVRVALA